MSVYFIQAVQGGPVKIGYTAESDVGRRLAALQTGSPVRLRLLAVIPGDTKLERSLHVRFGDLRLHGEWFTADDRISDFIGRALRGGDGTVRLPGAPLSLRGSAGRPYWGVQGREPIDHRRYRRLINLLLVRGEWFRAKDIAEQLGDRRYSERSRCSWAVAKLSTLHRKGWVVRRERFEDGQRIIEFAFRELA